jgi:hypothetical protein
MHPMIFFATRERYRAHYHHHLCVCPLVAFVIAMPRTHNVNGSILDGESRWMCRALTPTPFFVSFFLPTLIPAVGWIPPSDPHRESGEIGCGWGHTPFLLLYGIEVGKREKENN